MFKRRLDLEKKLTSEKLREGRNLLIFLYAERAWPVHSPLGLFIVAIFRALTSQGGETTECSGTEVRRRQNAREYESSRKGHHCGIFIFIQKKLKILTCPDANTELWSLYRSSFLFWILLSVFFYFRGWTWINLTTRGRGSLSSVIKFAFSFFFFSTFNSTVETTLWSAVRSDEEGRC